jgi:hypothetical protein
MPIHKNLDRISLEVISESINSIQTQKILRNMFPRMSKKHLTELQHQVEDDINNILENMDYNITG